MFHHYPGAALMPETKRSSVEYFRLKRLVQELESKEGRATELVSLYVPPGRQISDAATNLREEYGTAANIKSKSTKKNVQDAIESILQRLKLFRMPPENGLIIFAGAIPRGGPGSEKMETFVIEPPEPINIYYYRCDARFFLDPIKDMLTEKDIYGMIVMDRSDATFALLRGRRLEILETLTSGVPSKHDAGGQSARRFQRLIEIAANEFNKRVADHAESNFLKIENLKGIIIGGPGPTKEDFHKGNFLHYQLQKKVMAVEDLGYTEEPGVYELVEKSQDTLKNVEFVKEKKLMQNFLLLLAKSPNQVTYGEKEVRDKLSKGLVKSLMLSAGLENYRVKYKCQLCGSEKDLTLSKEALLSKGGRDTCEKCGGLMEEGEEKSIVDELAEIAANANVKVEVVSTETDEGKMLLGSFGGIVAILRYATSES
jgi:peptide chain release factor subunit 1